MLKPELGLIIIEVDDRDRKAKVAQYCALPSGRYYAEYAENVDELAESAMRAVGYQGVTLDQPGHYSCPERIGKVARFKTHQRKVYEAERYARCRF